MKITEKTLRELMISNIKHYGWLDDHYPDHDNNLMNVEEKVTGYVEYLSKLKDEEFFYTYHRVLKYSDKFDSYW